MTDQLETLRMSVARLRGIVEGLEPNWLEAPAYPAEWTVADVLSHLGSGAVIFRRRLEDIVAGNDTPPDATHAVWDEWNAKSAKEQAADFLAADQGLLDAVDALDDGERERFEFAFGPMTFDFGGFVGLRLNEHALHTWDIEVTLDPTAVVTPDSTRFIIDRLQMITRHAAKPAGTEHTVNVRTSEPRRDFSIAIGADAVSLEPAEGTGEPDLEIPAEAFIRLVYGRLDPDHTPLIRGSADVDELRKVFPGP